MNHTTKSTLSLAIAIVFSQIAHGALWTSGHGDLGIGYEDGGLELHWHLGEDNEPVTLNGTTAPLGPEGAEYEPNEIRPKLSNLTENISGTSYYVFPATENPTVPFIGFGTEELNTADWTGDLTLSLTGASGPGSFSLFDIDSFGQVTTLMDSSDGFSTVDSITLAPETHTHYTWAFSQRGIYALSFEVSGTHVSDGFVTDIATYTIVPEPSTAGLILGAAALALTMARRRLS